MIVYKITNTINGKAYIGQSQTSLERRWTLHKSDAKRNIDNYHFHKAIRKYGTDCWILEILEEINDIELLNEAEKKWIEYYDTFNNGYNSTNGGENGYIISDEVKKRMRNNHWSKKEYFIPSMLGKHHTEETKQKMRDKSNNMSEEHKKKLSLSKLGHIVSEETKQKMRLAKLGKKRGKYK